MDVPRPSSTSSQDSGLPSWVENVSISALESLACRHGKSQHVTVQSPPLRGSFNLVYPLTFPDGRKWIARIPDPASFDQPLMESTMVTLRLICQKTTIPIPDIHVYDTTSDNELGMPYILMEFVDGVPLGSIWKDENIVDDAARRHIFTQIAGYMSQLGSIQFDKIGILKYDEDSGEYSVGPYRWENRAFPNNVRVTESGPFTTTHAFLSHLVDELITVPNRHPPLFAFLRLFVLSLPDSRYDGAPFVLSPPDFDSQNVLVDPKTFKVTAFIDWDGVCVKPRLGGFARYPAWITRDWDPAIYDWRDPRGNGGTDADQNDKERKNEQESHSDGSHSIRSNASSFVNYEESPETIQRHRDLYLSIYSSIDPENADITRQSHVFEALDIALHSPHLASEILIKLCSHVFNADCDFMSEMFLGLGLGGWFESIENNL